VGAIKKAQRVAEKLVGLHYNAAMRQLDGTRCRYRFIVSEGLACGRNASVGNSDICLFSDENDRITRAVVGSKGIYNDPEFLALEAAGKTHLAMCAPYDVADYLTSEEAIAAYADEFKDETDPKLVAHVQADIERARARLVTA
jgi:hypothetical protein